jgi:NTP pyrophosphatase (non-canonical NTP hydrolase)
MKTKRPYAQVKPIVEKLVDRLSAYCDRIEIAGSLRRQANEIGDIEIVAIPTLPVNLFGEIDGGLPTTLDGYLSSLLDAGHIRHVARQRWGAKLKSFMLTTTAGETHQVDLFLQGEDTMTLNEYQVSAHLTSQNTDIGGCRLSYPVLGLVGEAGEVANKLKKVHRDHHGVLDENRARQIAKEAGDCLWYVAEVCTQLGISLNDVAKGNLLKLSLRRERGVIGGEGDER